jgi:hypothetical protein
LQPASPPDRLQSAPVAGSDDRFVQMAQGLAVVVVGMHDRFQVVALLAGFAQAVVIGYHRRIGH